ncbi:MAG: ribonuclease HIII [Planctomycetota bacterium]|nr:ribonuclease HIII [Planctomycetota bacterium]
MNDFAQRVRGLVERAEAAGWTVAEERTIPYGRLVVFVQGVNTKATLSCYHGKKGFKVVLGGKAADDLGAALGHAPKASASGPAVSGPDPFELGLPRIGGDESGKGDYFGPLVVAAWHLVEDDVDTLREIGVTDSKRLSDAGIQRMAGKLEALERGHVIAMAPAVYNEAYRETGNLNRLLEELHGRCVRALLEKAGDDAVGMTVLIDRFANRDAGLRGRLPRDTKLVTRTKAEADPAVAAASILARAAFVEGLKQLEHEYGCAFPPGAGNPVLRAGREFVRAFGTAELPDVAKVHFATTRRIT